MVVFIFKYPKSLYIFIVFNWFWKFWKTTELAYNVSVVQMNQFSGFVEFNLDNTIS